MASDIEGGPGWVIRGEDLRPAITDRAVFRDAHSEDELFDVLDLLWSGQAARALELLDSFENSPRVRALRADCLRDLGHHDRALHMYDALVEESVGTPREAAMRQHRGKVHLVAGDPVQALRDFERAVKLRRDGDASLLTSSLQAFGVASDTVKRLRHD